MHPSANRVYAEASVALTVAELGRAGADTARRPHRARPTPTRIAGVPYLTFDGDLADADLAHLGDVSTAMALFERDERER